MDLDIAIDQKDIFVENADCDQSVLRHWFRKEPVEYKCSICGNLVQVFLNGKGELVCCGEKMQHLIPNTAESDANLSEKHIPIIEQEEDKKYVRLKLHPMIPEHYIQFIEVYPKDKSRLYSSII